MGKLAKKYIKLAQKKVPSSQWRARGLKTAWALQKKAQKGGGKAKKPAAKPKGKTGAKSNPKGASMSRKSQKIGAVLKGARAVDTISGPAQGVAIREGATSQQLFARYDNRPALETSAKGAAVGLVRNVITSKSGAYRGVSQNKILSYVQVLAPEITAAGKTNPLNDPKGFNDRRHIAHEAYDPSSHTFNAGFAAFRESAFLQAVAWGGQKLAQKLGVNRMLPKGVNL